MRIIGIMDCIIAPISPPIILPISPIGMADAGEPG
jgi:hypothetical protein